MSRTLRFQTAVLLLSLITPCAFASEGSIPESGSGAEHPGVHRSFMDMYRTSHEIESPAPAPVGYVIHPRDDTQRNASLTREVFGYFPYWFRTRWTQLDYRLLSTVAYFSGEVNADGSVGNTHGWPKYSGDPSATADVISMINTAHANGVRVVLCFTNFTSADIDALVGTPACRATFIQQALAIVQAGNGDGVNINFEGINSASRNALTQFMQALADSFHTRMPGSQVSCAPTDFDTRAGDWDLAALYTAVDLFFFQGYGYGWSGTGTTRPVGLLPNTSFWGSLNITTFIDYVLARMPADKAVLGVPHYGYRWPAVSGEPKAATQGKGAVFYYPDALGYVATYGRQWEQSALSPWCRYQDGTQWYQGWYDDPQSMSYKYQFVLDRNLKGVGMWALGMDAGNHDIWDVLAQYMTDSGPISWIPSAPVPPALPHALELRQNYPNPFNPVTVIEYVLPRAGFVSLRVVNVLGQEVAALVDEEMEAGNHRVTFDAAGMASGTYFAMLNAGGKLRVKSMVILK